MNLLAVIVAYHPDHSTLVSNIEKIIEEVEHLVVYKNSEISIQSSIVERFGDKIDFIGSEKNVGISKALNDAIIWAKGKDFTHILTLDQDSFFKEGHLARFRSLVDENVTNLNVGVYVPNYINRGSLCSKSNDLFEEVEMSITSGSIIELSLFDRVGGFNEVLFIDAVDNDFCYRIKAEFDLSTVLFPSILLVHELGYMTKTRFGFYTMNYSAFRTYYIVRNNIYLWRKYPEFYHYKLRKLLIKDYIIYRVIKVLIAESDKFRKIKSIILGVYHGIFMRL